MTNDDLSGLGDFEDEAPIAPRRPARVSDDTAIAMAIQAEYGATSVDLGAAFGLNPRTVRAAIRRVSEEDRRMIGMIASQELAGLHQQLARKAIYELLKRDFGRVRTDGKGNPIEGDFRLSEVALGTVAGISSDKATALRDSAGMGARQDGAGTSSVAAFLRNGDDLGRLTKGLPRGAKLSLNQSLEIVGGESEESSSGGPVDASFEIGE